MLYLFAYYSCMLGNISILFNIYQFCPLFACIGVLTSPFWPQLLACQHRTIMTSEITSIICNTYGWILWPSPPWVLCFISPSPSIIYSVHLLLPPLPYAGGFPIVVAILPFQVIHHILSLRASSLESLLHRPIRHPLSRRIQEGQCSISKWWRSHQLWYDLTLRCDQPR